MGEVGGDHVIKLCCRDLAFKIPLYKHFRKTLLGAEKRLFRRGGREGKRFSTNGRRIYSPSFQRLAVNRPVQARWTFSPAKALREWNFSRLNSRRARGPALPRFVRR